jgi:hypothetical protein
VRQLKLEKEGRLGMLHGARAERRCARDAAASIERRLARNLARAEAALGAATLQGEVRREVRTFHNNNNNNNSNNILAARSSPPMAIPAPIELLSFSGVLAIYAHSFFVFMAW